jgi:SEC-C motif-containing protein
MEFFMDCACHSGLEYEKCCKPYHDGYASAPTALALMRSRYAAYALGKTEYVMDTTHPASVHFHQDRSLWNKELKAFSDSTQFTGLSILESSEDQVTFIAHLMQGSQDCSFCEESLFKKVEGKWYYLEGKHSS